MVNRHFKINNFDLIRLIAALQVAFTHAKSHLHIDPDANSLLHIFFTMLSYFPGVPIFFFVSGYLISKSYEKTSSLQEYLKNRSFRIFPALILCNLVGIFLVYMSGYFGTISLSVSKFLLWFTAQNTFLQFYNPDFMRGFGAGVLNGSLWTISVELQFYILTPILYMLLRRYRRTNTNKVLLLLVLLFLFINVLYHHYKTLYENLLLIKLTGVSFLPWFYMFLVGVLFQKNFETLYKRLLGKAFYLFVGYLLFTYVSKNVFHLHTGNTIGPIIYLPLCLAIFSFAYTSGDLSNRLLRKNDISYGIYVYHMLFVNLYVFYGYTEKLIYLLYVILSTTVAGILSWRLLERPILKLKKESIHKIQ